MDTSLSLSTPAANTVAPAPVLPRALTAKVQAVETAGDGATLPSEKPFVAQVVTARLSGSEYPENPGEIMPPERTLRPYDVPMLPSESAEDPLQAEVTVPSVVDVASDTETALSPA